ncbi:HAMP domain-containing sensor histidine kinase, partial [Clostridium paraputrificum]
SINILTVKNLYIFILYNKYPYNISVLGYVLTFMAFLVIIIGLFYEMIFRVKESDQLKHNLNVFYAANEKNLQSNILVYNDNYKIVYANELARGVIDEGITLEDQYNRLEKISIFNINEDLSKNIKKVLEENGTYSNILYFSELKKYYEVHLQKVVTDDSKWIIGNFIDKTDKCEAIDKLKISENRLKSVTENILDFIITIDTSGIITFANTSAIESLGFEVEELVGHRYEEFLKRDDGDIFAINNIKNSDIIKHKILCKNGKSVRVESVFKRINSEFKGYVVVSRSLEMKEELNSLRVKYNEIKEYDRIRAEFFANLSHEVRTPINIIYSCLQLLNNQKKNGYESLANYYIKYEKTISQNAFRLLRLVNNLIDISKLDTGAMQIKIKNIDIISLIENITLSTVPYVEEKNINIMFDTSIEELIVGCDPEKIERVMLNLISNSVKFTPTGGEIFVDIQVDETWVYVRVKDTGIGIPMHLKDVIFERFVQSNKSFSREREGSGIGLALVKDIISKHNGEVMLEDSSEIGSTFLFKIPNLVRDDVWHDDDNRAAETAIQEKINIEFSDIYDI